MTNTSSKSHKGKYRVSFSTKSHRIFQRINTPNPSWKVANNVCSERKGAF